MKNLKIKHVLYLLLAVLISACSNDEEVFEAEVNLQPVALELDITSIVLDATNTGNPAISISWQDTDYGVQTAVNYDVQMSNTASFDEVVSLGVVTNTSNSLTLSVNTLNKSASELGFTPFMFSDAFVRVQSYIGTTRSLETSSNTVAFEISPFFTYPFGDLFIVGNATEAGWNNNNENPLMIRDSQNDNLFTYTGLFLGNTMQFKALEQRGAWQPQWGSATAITNVSTSAEGSASVNAGDGDDPAEFEISVDGYYTFTLNTDSREFSIVQYDMSSATDYTQVTVTGDATTGDIALEQSAFDPHIWSVLSTALTTGNIQFSLDGTNYGGSSEFSGTSAEGETGVPIPVADDYEIWFNDLTKQYGMIPINLSN